MKGAVISGVTGFIGSTLARQLLKRGIKVLGLGRNATAVYDLKENSNFQFADINAIAGGYLKEYDVFFHLAYEGVSGKKKEDYYVQIRNIEKTCDAFFIAESLGCKRFIFGGSVDEYEVAHKPDTHLERPTHSWIYGSGKFACENFLKGLGLKKGIEYIGALMVLSYGEGNATNILPNMMIRKSFLDKKIALVEGNHYYDMLYIEDTVNALINLAENGVPGESYYVGHRNIGTFRKLVSDINNLLGLELQLEFGLYQEEGEPLDYRMMDREKMFRDTGFECSYDLEEGIRRTYEWLIKKL